MPIISDTNIKIKILFCKKNAKGASLKRSEFFDHGVNRLVMSELTIRRHKTATTMPAATTRKVTGAY
jgi:hypothetical protein